MRYLIVGLIKGILIIPAFLIWGIILIVELMYYGGGAPVPSNHADLPDEKFVKFCEDFLVK